ncbi:MAG: hypothetical protein KF708_21315 [Pirellulales bacterium]|nr:hypothetical protein [Pirellulales bacterium]
MCPSTLRNAIGRSLPVLVLAALTPWCALAEEGDASAPFTLPLRSRVELYRGSGEWQPATVEQPFSPGESALLLCDMWDRHWCPSATARCGELAAKMAPLVDAARAAGVLIIHAPSDTMDFYRDHPARKRALAQAKIELPPARDLSDPPLPIDDSDGGCDDDPAPQMYKAWQRQHPLISIADEDLISDDGELVYSHLERRGVKQLFVMGVHTNMCVLGRSFGIRQMARWGMPCVLVRDLTDTMYDPKDRPFVTHNEGTALVVEHIERHWCPSVASDELLRACGIAPAETP